MTNKDIKKIADRFIENQRKAFTEDDLGKYGYFEEDGRVFQRIENMEGLIIELEFINVDDRETARKVAQEVDRRARKYLDTKVAVSFVLIKE